MAHGKMKSVLPLGHSNVNNMQWLQNKIFKAKTMKDESTKKNYPSNILYK